MTDHVAHKAIAKDSYKQDGQAEAGGCAMDQERKMLIISIYRG